jgi:hypothetical protein
MDLHRRLSTLAKKRRDDEDRTQGWLTRRLSKLQRKPTALDISNSASHEQHEVTRPLTVNDILETVRVPSRFPDESVENRISQLPEEILLSIFELVITSPKGTPESLTNDLASCAETCQQWHRIASPLLYQHFVLNLNYDGPSDRDYFNFRPPCDLWWWTPSEIPQVASWIQSLTIELHFAEAGTNRRGLPIINVLSLLPNLTTLSVRAAPLEYQHYLSKHQLQSVVDALPSTITNFELDTKGRDTASWNSSRSNQPLCAAISSKLSQFRHLRLRMGVMCPLLFESLSGWDDKVVHPKHRRVQMPNLETAIFFLLGRDFSKPRLCCRDYQWSLEQSRDQKLLSRLQETVAAGCFPNARRIVFAHLVPAVSTARGMLENYRWEKETQAWFEGRRIVGLHHGFVFCRTENASSYQYGGETVEKWVDGDVAWVEGTNGSRRPR